jgi:hypothetical protein
VSSTSATPKPGFRMELKRIKMPHQASPQDRTLTAEQRRLMDAAEREGQPPKQVEEEGEEE